MRIWLYLRAHPRMFFTEDHVAAQVKIGRRRTRAIVAELVLLGKLDRVETVSSMKWGRPKAMYRVIRTTEDSLDQLEAFRGLSESILQSGE